MGRAKGVLAGLEGIRMATSVYTGIIEREGAIYVALCPELDVASQGSTVEEATGNLREAVELFLGVRRRRRSSNGFIPKYS
jgi:predicted RNase H-like HicB family nuclease